MSSRELTLYERETYFPKIKEQLNNSKTDKEIENALNDYMENVVEKNPEDYSDMSDEVLTETIVSAVVLKLKSSGGRRRRSSKKHPTARRRRSSKARNSRKVRKSRTTRRKY